MDYRDYFCIQELLQQMSSEELARLSGDPTGQTIDIVRIKQACKNAMAIIKAYLPNRINKGIDPVNDQIINKIAVDLTLVHLYEYANAKTSLPLTIMWRRTNAMRLLKDLQEGDAHLLDTTPCVSAPPRIVSNKSEEDGYFREITDNLI